MSVPEAAKKLDIRPAYGLAPPDRLTQLEGGERDPARPMLVKMAKAYQRLLVVFYLAGPPRKADVGTDFRRLRRGPPAGEPPVQALLREAIARQSIIRDVLLDDDVSEIEFVGSMTLADGHEAVIEAVRELIDAQGTAVTDARSAFDVRRRSAEEAGVFVLLQGDLGSYQTDIDTGAFRGFALADRIAPLVVVNDNDARTAWSFTLVHELVHLLFGETGVSDSREHTGVERFCDNVASEHLLPKAVLSRIPATSSFDAMVATIAAVAAEHNVSRALVAYCWHRESAISKDHYRRAIALFRSQWLRSREQERERSGDGAGGPSYYVVRRHRAGKALIDLVRRSIQDGSLPATKAAIVLGVKPTQVGPMLAQRVLLNHSGALGSQHIGLKEDT